MIKKKRLLGVIAAGLFVLANIITGCQNAENTTSKIDSKDTVRGTAKKFGVSKSTVHKDVTLWSGLKLGQVIPESIEIKKVFLAEKKPVVKLGLVIK